MSLEEVEKSIDREVEIHEKQKSGNLNANTNNATNIPSLSK